MEVQLRLFWAYIKHPYFLKGEKIEWSLYLKLLALYYFISLPLGLIVAVLIKLLNFQETEFIYNSLKILFVGLILGPIIEEILFRLLLLPTYKNFIIFSSLSFLLAIGSLINGRSYYSILFLTIGVTSVYFCLNRKPLKEIQKYLMNHFQPIFYFSCLLFGFYHITNFLPINYKLILLMPIIVFPQIILGTFMAYIRMKFGIIYSILFHSITNIFPVFVLIINN